MYAEDQGRVGEDGDTCSPLGLRSRAMCHPEESELRDMKPGWRLCGPILGTNSEIGPSAPLLQQTVLAVPADRAGCAPGTVAGLVREVSSPTPSTPVAATRLPPLSHCPCPFALTLPLESGLAGGMLSLGLVQYGMAEKRLYPSSFLKTLTFLLWPLGCLDTTLSCHGIIAVES